MAKTVTIVHVINKCTECPYYYFDDGEGYANSEHYCKALKNDEDKPLFFSDKFTKIDPEIIRAKQIADFCPLEDNFFTVQD